MNLLEDKIESIKQKMTLQREKNEPPPRPEY